MSEIDLEALEATVTLTDDEQEQILDAIWTKRDDGPNGYPVVRWGIEFPVVESIIAERLRVVEAERDAYVKMHVDVTEQWHALDEEHTDLRDGITKLADEIAKAQQGSDASAERLARERPSEPELASYWTGLADGYKNACRRLRALLTTNDRSES